MTTWPIIDKANVGKRSGQGWVNESQVQDSSFLSLSLSNDKALVTWTRHSTGGQWFKRSYEHSIQKELRGGEE